MSDNFIFTSESVTKGHPDKLCDQVSDAIVDHVLIQDPDARIIAECALSSGILFISVHYASVATLEVTDVARRVIRDIGYPKAVFDAENCSILTSIMDHTADDYEQLNLEDLSDKALSKITARQQASVFGYACDQTPELMPLPIWLAHRLAYRMDGKQVAKRVPYLLPDSEIQVGIEFNEGRPERIQSITLVATQREDSDADLEKLREDITRRVISPVLKKEKIAFDDDTEIHINPGGIRRGGGPATHSGLTGRKTGIDTYGGYARTSSAALSGKDPMRIDRIGAYIARYAAKNVVAAGLARECEIQLSYTIGKAQPVSIRVRTFGTSELSNSEIADRLNQVIDFRPAGIVNRLRLKSLSSGSGGFYRKLAVYGHMGRTAPEVPWEQTDIANSLKK